MHETKFIIIIRGRNCAKYIRECLGSLYSQTYSNWCAIVSLDAPKDDSYNVATSFNPGKFENRVNIVLNKERLGLCQNLWRTVKSCNADPEDVFAFVDADDWLAREALETVANVYRKNPDCLLTYGSYIKVSKGAKTKVSKPHNITDNVRKCDWHLSHIKTMKVKLFNKLTEDMFKDKNGNWLEAASDLAMMIPAAEIAGLQRCYHIYKPTYYWRNETPFKTNYNKQKDCEKIIRSKPMLSKMQII